VHAQERELTLEQCRHLALDHNKSLRNAQTKVTAAGETSKEAFTNYFPTVRAAGMAYDANKGLIQMEMVPGETMNLLKDGVVGGVALTQPIFAGGQIVNGNKLAKLGVEVSELQQEQTRKEVLLNVEKYYWQVVSLREKRKTLNSIDEMLTQICSEVETAVNAGLTTRNDLLQVQLRKNDIASAIINLDNNLTLSKMVLAQYIGLNGEDINISASESIEELPIYPSDLKVDFNDALLNTPEYKLLDKNVRASELQKKMEVGKNLPSVGAGVGYLYDNLTGKDHPFGIAFVSVSIPISDWWGGSHAIKKKQADIVIANNTRDDSSELLVINMQHLWNEVDNAYKQILIAHQSIDQSEENLRLNRNYYNAGMSTMSDLLDAQSLYQQSHDNLVEVYSQFQIKLLEYRNATCQ
jgi:outer membrane protein TolC